jgi:hypothetical protein
MRTRDIGHGLALASGVLKDNSRLPSGQGTPVKEGFSFGPSRSILAGVKAFFSGCLKVLGLLAILVGGFMACVAYRIARGEGFIEGFIIFLLTAAAPFALGVLLFHRAGVMNVAPEQAQAAPASAGPNDDLLLRVLGYLAILIGGLLLIGFFSMRAEGSSAAAAVLVGIILRQHSISPHSVSAEILGIWHDAVEAATLATRGGIGVKELYGALARGEPERLSFIQDFAIYYGIAGFVLSLALYRLVNVVVTQAVWKGLGGVILLAAGAFFGTLYWYREDCELREKSDWGKALFVFAALTYFSSQYALGLNCLAVLSRDVTYSGVVEEKAISEIDFSTRRIKASANVTAAVFQLFWGRTSHCLYLRDAATKERIKLVVGRNEYDRLHQGDSFAQTAHIGRLGVAYRWAWE